MLPTASYRCDISSKGAVLLAGAMTRRWAAQTRYQRWNRGQKARGQGHKKISRSRPRKDPLEAKDTDASVLKKKFFKKFFQAKKVFKNFFSGDLYLRKPKKRSLQIFRKVSGVFQRNFNGSKIVLSSSRGQGNFRGLEASRPRTSKCVLEAKDVLEDSISARYMLRLTTASIMKDLILIYLAKILCHCQWRNQPWWATNL